MRRVLLFALIMMASARANGQAQIDIGQRMRDRNDLIQVERQLAPYYTTAALTRLNTWLNHPQNTAYVADCQYKLRPFFKAERTIGVLCYFLRQDDQARRKMYLTVVRRHILEMNLALQDISEDERYSRELRSRAEQYRANFKDAGMITTIQECFKRAMATTYPSDGTLSFTPFQEVGSCMNQRLPKIGGGAFVGLNLQAEFPASPGHAVSDTGWIPGNKITYSDENDRSAELGQKILDKSGLMERLYPLSGRGSFEAMSSADPRTVFTEQEGFTTIDNDMGWSQTTGIYPLILQTLDSARETIFIDIFFMGGTMGASMAKYLVKLLEAKPNLKAFVLRDNVNHFGHDGEMRPVFNFLAAYSQKNPKRLMAVSSHIKSHRSGLPKILDRVVTDDFLKYSGLNSHLALYGRAVSDHSKVFVVDGKSDSPVAIVGSKNWTDVSGLWGYDDVAKIEGPAAAIVQDDFYDDMFFALKYEMPAQTVKYFADNGWAAGGRSASTEAAIVSILRPFDLLDRDASGQATRQGPIAVKARSNVAVRTGLNNVDSTRTNIVDQVVQSILLAKQKILIKDQFIFDRNVTLALMRAKRENPKLDVRLVLEPLNAANPKGMPNLLYLDALRDAGVGIRWAKKNEGTKIEQDYHFKTVSTDGTYLICGSANKDQTTMYGAFREEQVQVADAKTAQIHDQSFERDWQNGDEFSEYEFAVPHDLKGLDGNPLKTSEFIGLLRNVVAILFDAGEIF